MKNHLFINPYNFVPFGTTIEQKRKSRESAYRGEKHQLISGWLTVRLDTKTPLIIPDGAHPKYWDIKKEEYVDDPGEEQKKDMHKEYSFMRVPDCEDGQPVIPGSELRGMIRSVYEAVTDSCVAFLLNDKPISQRVPVFGALKNRGLLAYEKISEDSEEYRWKLYSTVVTPAEVKVDVKGLKYLDGTPVEERNGTYIKGKGWLQYNIPVNKKKPYHIAYLKEKEVIYTWDFVKDNGMPDDEKNNEPYRLLKTALNRQNKSREEKNRDKNKGPNKNIADALEQAKKGCGNKVPVYYLSVKRGDEELIYLSNSSIGRIAQRRKWKEILGIHAPCDSTDRLCPACLLFGTIQDKGMKGRIRVTDAVPLETPKPEFHTLQILSEPRPSAFEFYLKKPDGENVTYWNFDFYVKGVEDGKEKDYFDLSQATPRGRKMYWHSPIAADDCKRRMNTTMEAMNGPFRFYIYFDEISEEQLKDLIWVITLGDNKEDSTKQHKLGHAKPLGYGSVKLTVEEKVIRRISVAEESLQVKLDRTEAKNICTEAGKELDDDLVENLLIMCDTQSVPEDIQVMYPKAVDSDFIYSWFANNRKNAKWLKTLPVLADNKRALEKNGKISNNKKENSYLAKIISRGHSLKNKNYLEYDVKILNDEKFCKKKCLLTAHKSKRLIVGSEVEVTLYKGSTFNIK